MKYVMIVLVSLTVAGFASATLKECSSEKTPPPLSKTFSGKAVVTIPPNNSLGYWARSYLKQTSYFEYTTSTGMIIQNLRYFCADNRTLYRTEIEKGSVSCEATPLADNLVFNYFLWLTSGQALCYEDSDTEVWSSVPSDSDDRIRVIEVDKSDRTKMKQYGELKSPSREVIYTITFLNFDKKEKDLPVFKVPAVCF